MHLYTNWSITGKAKFATNCGILHDKNGCISYYCKSIFNFSFAGNWVRKAHAYKKEKIYSFLCLQGWHHCDCQIPRESLLPPNQLLWMQLYHLKNEQALITLTEFDHSAFSNIVNNVWASIYKILYSRKGKILHIFYFLSFSIISSFCFFMHNISFLIYIFHD